MISQKQKTRKTIEIFRTAPRRCYLLDDYGFTFRRNTNVSKITIENGLEQAEPPIKVRYREGSWQKAKWRMTLFARSAPWLYVPIKCRRAVDFEGNSRSLNRDTEIVIDAYPRSGNTFATVAFQTSQKRPVKVAHHFHAPAVIAFAARNRIPTLTIIRDPRQACLSAVLLSQRISIQQAFREYICFYQTVVRFRPDIVVARFETVTSQFGKVVEKINETFGTAFDRFDDSGQSNQKVQEHLKARSLRRYGRMNDDQGKGTVPSEKRAALKRQFAEWLSQNNQTIPGQKRAMGLFNSLTAEADV